MADHNPQSIRGLMKEEADDLATLQIFDIIEQEARISQQRISMKTGLAAAIVHSFMSRIIKKGWVRAKQVNAKRWLYFITPTGFAEKSRIMQKYLARTLRAYRLAQKIVHAQLGNCLENNWTDLVVVGSNELAEIAALNIRASKNHTLIAVVSEKGGEETIAGEAILPFGAVESLKYHKLLVCDSSFTHWNLKYGPLVNDSKMLNLDKLYVTHINVF